MTTPLDPANDPDRYDPTREAVPPEAPPEGRLEGPLDWAFDPDRYDPAKDKDAPPKVERPPLVLGRTGGRRSTLPELIGKESSFQDSPSPYIWVVGLIGIAAFLLLFAFVFSHLSP
jgi:hypothetical protein